MGVNASLPLTFPSQAENPRPCLISSLSPNLCKAANKIKTKSYCWWSCCLCCCLFCNLRKRVLKTATTAKVRETEAQAAAVWASFQSFSLGLMWKMQLSGVVNLLQHLSWQPVLKARILTSNLFIAQFLHLIQKHLMFLTLIFCSASNNYSTSSHLFHLVSINRGWTQGNSMFQKLAVCRS